MSPVYTVEFYCHTGNRWITFTETLVLAYAERIARRMTDVSMARIIARSYDCAECAL